jgi:hypothetical protein
MTGDNYAPDYVFGRYALVDYNYGFIWLNVSDIETAYLIKKVVTSHVTLVVVDLVQLDSNYSDQLIDNTVCLDWRVDLPTKSLMNYLEQELRQGVTIAPVDATGGQLTNCESHTMLTKDRVVEFQKCLVLLYHIHLLVNPRQQQSIRMHSELTNYINTHLNNIYNIFSTEISYSQIVNQLYDYSNNHLENSMPLTMIILRLIGRQYD